MNLSETCIHRPVFAIVMTLLLMLFGFLSFLRLPVREYPDIKPPIVSVRTVYPGASASVVELDVTTPLEDVLSGIQGLRTMTSASREEVSSVTLEFELGRDLDGATNDVRDRVSQIRPVLPLGILEPHVEKAAAENTEVLWLAVSSDRYSELELSDLADRFIKAQLAMIPGVSSTYLDGERRYAMRIWLDPDRLAARRLTVEDVEDALRNQNASIPAGRIESNQMEFSVSLKGTLQTPKQFESLIMAYREGYPVRLEDVARVELAAEDTRKVVRFNGKSSLGISVSRQSKANTLAVVRAVREQLPSIAAGLPEGVDLTLAWDSSTPIERSLDEVYIALGLSLFLVVLVIFCFLGSARATLIPAVAIPASIIGTCTIMAMTGCSLNILTLLGLVLAVGLVVDDAIIVLENIHRRIVAGMPPVRAAIEGTNEIAFAVIATTISLVAVFVPIAFVTDIVGRLFTELAIAVASAVLLSGFVALTLTPMMSGRLLRQDSGVTRFRFAARLADDLSRQYRRGLGWVMNARVAVVIVAVGASLGSLSILNRLPSELAPLEDTGWFSGFLIAPQGATLRYTDTYAKELESLLRTVPEIAHTYTMVALGDRPTRVNRAESWVTLKDWKERATSQQEIVAGLNQKLGMLTGVKAYLLNPSSLGDWSEKSPVQFVLGGLDYQELQQAAETLVSRLAGHPGFVSPGMDAALDTPHLAVETHRDKSADLGVSVASIGRTLETLLSGRPVNTFMQNGRLYKVILKVDDRNRETPSAISQLYVRGNDGALVQLNNIVTVKEVPAPDVLNHFDRMRAVTVSAGLADGFTLGQALKYLDETAHDIVRPGMRTAYAGESKTFAESNRNLYLTFVLALAVIFLVLAAQFESFRHPWTILLTVPPALSGSLLSLAAIGGTLTIYSQIGLVILIGLVTKNAILIVEFANQLRERGMEVSEAIIEAAALRLRPILMTTCATILGALPLALATGAGAAGRRQIGVVLIGGLVVSTLVTLVLVPAGYMILSGAVKGSKTSDTKSL
ncbi:efflux RND transporter permease subunit [Candidatus Nitrospira nitrificans]|uniref:Putative Multidrug efflux transporter n=1 Tax=Candidatus Nitrospira nitrificans TaxID=1742973 RepID=A0A0S4LNG6_9BACT|nr:efflux RND transporter permease subunit [Candidatus Nitrospira nitrificans]CUS37556.1 putative Multidrug efflux transporter [Candidatus Nitrospira nitrificans]